MMTIREQLDIDLKDAMRARDKEKLGVMRLIMAAIKQIEVDERITVDETRLLVILDKLSKQRNESISQFKAASRHDLVAKEEFELDIISQYLPEPLSEADIIAFIEEAIQQFDAKKMSDMGKVMAHLKPLMQGRADMSQVSLMIKAKLN
jgi:uncharacterized protein YqeY